ncbi:TetR/AcrR family transcriptional regulator [Thermodesulfobacteriota bacterium]
MELKKKIINETQKLFSLKGYMSTSIHDILVAGKTSKGGLYNYFNSKEELFYTVLDQSKKNWRERCFFDLDQIKSPIKKLMRFLENYRDLYLTDSETFPGGCIFVNLSVELDDQNVLLAKKVENGFVGLKKWIERLLDESKKQKELVGGTYTSDLTEIIFSVILGAAVSYGQDKSSANLNRTMNALINYIKTYVQ